MTIKIGDAIPACTLKHMQGDGPADITTEQIFGGKKVALFAVPGAFTPGCSLAHLPGYVVNADKLKAAGIDTIVCLSVNDAFVMGAWGKAQNADDILMLADGNAEFTRLLGLELDASGFGMGTRSRRYSLLADNGNIVQLNIEPGGDIDVSGAEHMLANL
jgi:peroxiredoxin